jgi:hypothetical protein
MPTISNVLTLEVTPEKFLEACSPSELMEVDMLIQGAYYQNKMQDEAAGQKAINELKKNFQ